MVFPVVMYGCESWTIKKAECWRIDAFELWCWRRLLGVPWTARRSNQSILKEFSPGLFIGRTDVEAETPILCPPDVKSWLIWKDPDAGKDWGQEEKWTTEDEMVGWHHWLNGHGFMWAPGVGEGQGGLACFSSWGCKELDTTEQLNWNWNWAHVYICLKVWLQEWSEFKWEVHSGTSACEDSVHVSCCHCVSEDDGFFCEALLEGSLA